MVGRGFDVPMEDSQPPNPWTSFEFRTPTITLADVGGLDDLAQELIHTIQCAINIKDSPSSGSVPNTALLCGPPGTGKSLLVEAIWNACNTRVLRIMVCTLLIFTLELMSHIFPTGK